MYLLHLVFCVSIEQSLKTVLRVFPIVLCHVLVKNIHSNLTYYATLNANRHLISKPNIEINLISISKLNKVTVLGRCTIICIHMCQVDMLSDEKICLDKNRSWLDQNIET